MRFPLLTLLVLAIPVASACKNACQQVCVKMDDYAKECGYAVPADQLDQCFERFKGSEIKELRSTCSAFGDPKSIRENWSCDDLSDFFGGESSGSDGADESEDDAE